jgi:hypothetical protein
MKAQIDKLDADLLERYRFDTELFERLTDRQRESGLLHGDRPITPFLRPYFLAESRYREIRRAARILSSAFEKLTRFALENDEVLIKLGISEKEARWARVEPGYRCISVNSRLDTFLSANGFGFLEYNAENPAGVGDQTALEQLFDQVPEVRRFLAENPHYFPQPHHRLIEALDQTYREFGGKKEKPSIAIVDWTGVATGSEFLILREYFESRGYPAKICDPAELEFRRGILHHEDFAIDIFFKRVIIHEFLDRFDEQHPLYKAMNSGAVCMANSFRSKIPHKKASFAILSDPRFGSLYTEEELTIIDRCIPWTRVVREERTDFRGTEVDLIEFIRREKERLVLKPNDDYGGKGIAIGWECNESEWACAIEAALLHPYVVQWRVPVEKTEIPMFLDGELRCESLLVDFDPFLFRGEVEGGMVRLSNRSLVNITQGGGETALAILKDF